MVPIDALAEAPSSDDDPATPAVLAFNAIDASGAGGLTANTLAIASMGAHALPVATGAFARDTTRISAFYPLDDEAIADQARTVLEDMPVQIILVGFAGHPEALSAIAGIATDYADVPLIAHMPDLSWWDEDSIETYQDAFTELLLPQTSVLAGNHNTLARWLLPDWSGERLPGPRDLARAASEHGVPYILVTGIVRPDQYLENVVATPHTVLASERFERIEAAFAGAGDTLTAALAGLLASGGELAPSAVEALRYLDQCLDAGFQPGMGQVIPDRLFWAQGEDEAPTSQDAGPSDLLPDMNHELKH
jgi:hydroxymethylpyrimidine/phosphomethylpyrimidine kinase